MPRRSRGCRRRRAPRCWSARPSRPLQRRDDLARLLALELGKPVKDGRGEIDRVADTFAVSAAEARRIGGEVLPVAGWARGVGNTALTHRAPVGVALAITPFNAPANLLAHKLAASFAAGNTTIVKPPPQAPAISAAVVALLLDAGMPAGGGPGAARRRPASARPCAPRRRSASSASPAASATGAAVARAAGAKRLVLELGGNAATIVCEDADVAAAARICAAPATATPGRAASRCSASTSTARATTSSWTPSPARWRSSTVGDPLDPATDVGSMVDDDAAERVVAWAGEAAAAGATDHHRRPPRRRHGGADRRGVARRPTPG